MLGSMQLDTTLKAATRLLFQLRKLQQIKGTVQAHLLHSGSGLSDRVGSGTGCPSIHLFSIHLEKHLRSFRNSDISL